MLGSRRERERNASHSGEAAKDALQDVAGRPANSYTGAEDQPKSDACSVEQGRGDGAANTEGDRVRRSQFPAVSGAMEKREDAHDERAECCRRSDRCSDEDTQRDD